MIAEKADFKDKGNNAAWLAKQYDWDVLAKKFHDKITTII